MGQGNAAGMEAPPHLSCLTCRIARSAGWCVQATDRLEQWDRAKVTRKYNPGESLFRAGEPPQGIYCIESGLIALGLPNHRSPAISTIASAGDVLGSAELFAKTAYRWTAECLDTAVVCLIPADSVRLAIERTAALGLAFLSRCANEVQLADGRMALHAIGHSRALLAKYLVSMKGHGVRTAESVLTIRLPVPWVQVAAQIGTRPDQLQRSATELEADGVLSIDGLEVRIGSLERLIAEMEPLFQ